MSATSAAWALKRGAQPAPMEPRYVTPAGRGCFANCRKNLATKSRGGLRLTTKLSDRRDKSMATKNTKSAKQNRRRRFAEARGYAAIREIREAIHQTRDDHADLIAAMPTKPKTAGQRVLQKKHGTPRAFARAVVNAIGEISVLEAQLAIRKYRDEWQAA